MAEKEGVRFREVQRFWRDFHGRRYKVLVVCGGMMVVLPVASVVLRYTQEGSNTSVVLSAMMLASAVSLIAILSLQRAETEVRGDGLCVRDFPFSFRKIALENAVGVEARRYDPDHYNPTQSEYGKSGEGKGYFLYGKEGVRIDYADGRHVLIGSQRPEELAEAIRGLLKDKGER